VTRPHRPGHPPRAGQSHPPHGLRSGQGGTDEKSWADTSQQAWLPNTEPAHVRRNREFWELALCPVPSKKTIAAITRLVNLGIVETRLGVVYLSGAT